MKQLNTRGRRLSTIRNMAYPIVFVLLGCGGGPSTVDRSAALNPPGQSLTALINQKMAAEHPAVVTFAVFGRGIRGSEDVTDSSRSLNVNRQENHAVTQ